MLPSIPGTCTASISHVATYHLYHALHTPIIFPALQSHCLDPDMKDRALPKMECPPQRHYLRSILHQESLNGDRLLTGDTKTYTPSLYFLYCMSVRKPHFLDKPKCDKKLSFIGQKRYTIHQNSTFLGSILPNKTQYIPFYLSTIQQLHQRVDCEYLYEVSLTQF